MRETMDSRTIVRRTRSWRLSKPKKFTTTRDGATEIFIHDQSQSTLEMC